MIESATAASQLYYPSRNVFDNNITCNKRESKDTVSCYDISFKNGTKKIEEKFWVKMDFHWCGGGMPVPMTTLTRSIIWRERFVFWDNG